MAFFSPDPVTMYLSSLEMSQDRTEEDSFDCSNEAPYGVRHALSTLSFPVETNHLPECANFNDNTQLSCRCREYRSLFDACST